MNERAHPSAVTPHDQLLPADFVVRQRAIALALEAWERAEHDLGKLECEGIPPRPSPARSDVDALELELERTLSAHELELLGHVYRSELHTLNAEHELAELKRRRGGR